MKEVYCTAEAETVNSEFLAVDQAHNAIFQATPALKEITVDLYVVAAGETLICVTAKAPLGNRN